MRELLEVIRTKVMHDIVKSFLAKLLNGFRRNRQKLSLLPRHFFYAFLRKQSIRRGIVLNVKHVVIGKRYFHGLRLIKNELKFKDEGMNC